MDSTAIKKTPLERLLTDFLPQGSPAAGAIDAQVKRIHELPPGGWLEDLQTPIYGNDPTELLKHRFLYRGGITLLCGPTGIGKSSLLMQMAIHWAIGRPLFDIVPGDCFQRDGMRILMVQAENDPGDLAEMRDGVLRGCTDLTDADRLNVRQRIQVRTIDDKSGSAFTDTLDALLAELGPFDLVIIDPAFAYLGGDGSSQKEVSGFMRGLLNPLAHKHAVGVLLAHHVNKPPSGKDTKNTWAAGDFAYLGAGSAEWVNPARAAFVLRNIKSETVFELRAVKRGRRLGWKDENGQPTTAQHIAHHGEPGVICWRRATAEEVAEVLTTDTGGRRQQFDALECVRAVQQRPRERQSVYADLVADALGCSTETARLKFKACVTSGWLRGQGDTQFRRYTVTETGIQEMLKKPSARNWATQ